MASPEVTPLFLQPVFMRRIWGGRQLETRFGYDGLPEGPVGECWGISAHPNGLSTVTNGVHAGRTLDKVWERDPGLFGVDDGAGPFPLLVKFLDANDWLSVQVHPDDAEAAELEGVPLGKCESWYVIAAQPDAELIIGHRAADREELATMVRQGRWDELLLRRKVRAGDFVYVPSGTLHSVGPGLLICEVQQNSDTTYRVWDFDRIDAATGTARELHLDKSLRVLSAPYDPATTDTAEEPVQVEGGSRQCLVRGEFFEVTRHVVDGSGYRAALPSFELCSVVEGAGDLRVGEEEYSVAAGAHFILPVGAAELRCSGEMTLISSRPPA